MAEELQESTITLDVDVVRPLLQRLSGLVSDGFGDSEVGEVVEAVERMEPDEETDLEFSVTYDGKPAELRIRIALDDPVSATLYFFSPARLAHEIDDEMAAFVEDQGL